MQPQLHLVRLDWMHNASRPWMRAPTVLGPSFSTPASSVALGSFSMASPTTSSSISVVQFLRSIICYKIHDGGFTQCLCMSFEW